MDNSFHDIGQYEGVCQSIGTNANATVTGFAGLSATGTTRVISCPAGRVITAIGGKVDLNQTPVQLSVTCS